MDLRAFTVSRWFQENCYLVRLPGAKEAVVVDPGDEAERLLAAFEELGVEVAGILLTHTHIDHIGAVAQIARAHGCEVWCPRIELPVLADPDAFNPWVSEIGSREGWEAEHALDGGERVELAGIGFDVVATPGHSPGHVTFAATPADGPPLLFSGDVLFQGSVGRTDLPGGDWPTLLASIEGLLAAYPDESRVLCGHGPATTLGRERAANPFLDELRAQR